MKNYKNYIKENAKDDLENASIRNYISEKTIANVKKNKKKIVPDKIKVDEKDIEIYRYWDNDVNIMFINTEHCKFPSANRDHNLIILPFDHFYFNDKDIKDQCVDALIQFHDNGTMVHEMTHLEDFKRVGITNTSDYWNDDKTVNNLKYYNNNLEYNAFFIQTLSKIIKNKWTKKYMGSFESFLGFVLDEFPKDILIYQSKKQEKKLKNRLYKVYDEMKNSNFLEVNKKESTFDKIKNLVKSIFSN